MEIETWWAESGRGLLGNNMQNCGSTLFCAAVLSFSGGGMHKSRGKNTHVTITSPITRHLAERLLKAADSLQKPIR